MYPKIAFVAYIIDMFLGEFKFIIHPIVIMGKYISWYEKKFYKDSKLSGFCLAISLITISLIISILLQIFLPIILIAIISSMFLAHNMLYSSVKEALQAKNKNELLAYLVSRDTKNLSNSDANKALIETYAENLSDGVIAPLFYLLLFGLPGIVTYKAINTLDSMVGYKTDRYKNFGYFSAKLDDVANLIPSRITAILILLIKRIFCFKTLFKQAKGHQSPNAGYPITAIALSYNLKLGGPTSYHGKIVNKPYFGVGKKIILDSDVLKVLSIKEQIDVILILFLFFASILKEIS